jgi:mono/diheme cytochrome c family protein
VNKLVKRSGMALGGVVALAAALFGVASLKASARLAQKFETHRHELGLPPAGDAAAIERGRHLVDSRYGCKSCHGQDLSGGVMIDEPPIGQIFGPNLTMGQGSRAAGYAMSDWDRVVRHGVKPDGTGALMPSEEYFKMSDAELSDIVAYVRSLPPVAAEVAAPRLGPVGRVLVALGKLPIAAEHPQANATSHAALPPSSAESVEFGGHLAATCTGCHRPNLAGGPMAFGPPDWPAAANLTQHASGLAGWSYEDFDRALTKGVGKDGSKLREPMAGVVAGTKGMSETEKKAMWSYLRSVEATTNEG